MENEGGSHTKNIVALGIITKDQKKTLEGVEFRGKIETEHTTPKLKSSR